MSRKQPTRYRCENPACTLGTPGAPGHFTGGISPEQVSLRTGTPLELVKPEEHGEGVCPNCGARGKAEK